MSLFEPVIEFFGEVLIKGVFEGIYEGLLWFADKKTVSKFIRVAVYSFLLLPIVMWLGYKSVKNYFAQDSIDAVALGFFSAVTFVTYLIALYVIFRKQE